MNQLEMSLKLKGSSLRTSLASSSHCLATPHSCIPGSIFRSPPFCAPPWVRHYSSSDDALPLRPQARLKPAGREPSRSTWSTWTTTRRCWYPGSPRCASARAPTPGSTSRPQTPMPTPTWGRLSSSCLLSPPAFAATGPSPDSAVLKCCTLVFTAAPIHIANTHTHALHLCFAPCDVYFRRCVCVCEMIYLAFPAELNHKRNRCDAKAPRRITGDINQGAGDCCKLREKSKFN